MVVLEVGTVLDSFTGDESCFAFAEVLRTFVFDFGYNKKDLGIWLCVMKGK